MPPVERPPRERVDLRAVVRFFAPVARELFEALVFEALDRLADLAAPVLRAALLRFFAVDRDLVAVERLAVDFLAVDRAGALRRVVLAARGALDSPSSIGHLPDITR